MRKRCSENSSDMGMPAGLKHGAEHKQDLLQEPGMALTQKAASGSYFYRSKDNVRDNLALRFRVSKAKFPTPICSPLNSYPNLFPMKDLQEGKWHICGQKRTQSS